MACSSKKKVIIAHSSTEVEYYAIANTTEELKGIKSLMIELGIKIESPLFFYI